MDVHHHHHFLSLFFIFLFIQLLPFASPSPSLAANKERCHPEDKTTLLDFKKSFSNHEGTLFQWTPDSDCCDWNSIQCDEKTNRVTRLTLLYSSVAGTIPDAVGRLTHLQMLRLHKLPNLIGQIPPSITKLKALDYLAITWTNISGPIPPFLAELQNLKFLLLSFNSLSGSIPPELSRLPNIVGIELDRNRLTGEIPESFGHFVGSVPGLRLSHNMLSGQIPKSLGNSDFSSIDLSRNQLVGDAFMFFNASKSTSTIDISRNMLEFDLSGVRFPSTNLISLDISHNRVFGRIPSQITEAIYLQFLNVTYNRLCGEIPQGWKLKYRSQSFDESSYLHNRCLCGPPLQPCKADGN
ncbi:polygalacturonase-inhibiting protein 1 [Cinnamomum micranthum f. kanehirae]|uniref:Polygalacturonase-inhibiting protein 1 n=1 Tax=Cinnamomum micranthum f. kanehirae TaxID=337451 RepID=A0A3S3Q364_9MAGN|nr:polygalacturonase-inhibiting protein 1 [Cinnamomum micranthum f. kanehirae]